MRFWKTKGAAAASLSTSRAEDAKRELRRLKREADAAVAAFNRAAAGGETYYSPLGSVNGTQHVPPSVWRKYAMLREAMSAHDVIEVHRLQSQLRDSGYEMPTTESEVDACLERLRAREAERARSYRR